MAGSRTLKLSILGDVDNLTKSLKTAAADTDDFGAKIGKAGKAIGAAFAAAAAAAGAYAVKIGIDGVKAAIEDEKAQTQLALALENATGATEGAIKATEEFVLQTSLATGVADDELRPALARLARSTGSVEDAQKLLNTALDISTATGKPLEGVANALAKAYDGNSAALGKLGLGLSAAELKTMNFTQIQEKLSDLFGGAAAANAETYSGRIARMQVAFNEAKETIGFALLPVLEKLMKFVNDFATPVLQAFNDGLSGKGGMAYYINYLSTTIKNVFTPVWEGLQKAFKSIKDAIGDNIETFKQFGAFISTYVAPVIGEVLGKAIEYVGKIAGGVVNIIAGVIKVVGSLVSGAIDGINAIIKAYNAVPILPNIPLISKPSLNISTPNIPSAPSVTAPSYTLPEASANIVAGGGAATTSGKSSSSGVAAASKTAEKAAADAAKLDAQYGLSAGYSSSAYAMEQANVDAIIAAVTAKVEANRPAVTVNMGVVGDPEAASRAIIDVLNRSSGRGALGAEALIL
jgi:hypothetical protein